MTTKWTDLRMGVCGIDELPEWRAEAPTHVLSLLDPGFPKPEALLDFAVHAPMEMRFHDIIDPENGKVMPTQDDVATILAYGRTLAAIEQSRLLVHCHMGVSRSTAALLALMAQSCPQTEDDQLFDRLRRLRPEAWPNLAMVAWTDEALGRGGRLVAALGRHYAWKIKTDPRYLAWMKRLKRHRELALAKASR